MERTETRTCTSTLSNSSYTELYCIKLLLFQPTTQNIHPSKAYGFNSLTAKHQSIGISLYQEMLGL